MFDYPVFIVKMVYFVLQQIDVKYNYFECGLHSQSRFLQK